MQTQSRTAANGRSFRMTFKAPRRILPTLTREEIEANSAFRPKEHIEAVKPRTNETDAEKAFRLVGERRFEEAASIAARLINADNDASLFIYGTAPKYRSYEEWYREQVGASRRSAFAGIHNVTPEIAQILLLNNDGNRRVDPKNLARLMRDLAADRWTLNGEAMVVSRDGRLNDGQHRAFSVLLTGRPVKTTVSFGVTRESMLTVNTGKPRGAADRLAIAGETNVVHGAAIAALAFEMKYRRKPTPVEQQDFYFENRDQIVVSDSILHAPKGVGAAAPGVAALHLLSLGAPAESLKEFFKLLRTGEMLKRRNPIYALREAIREKLVKQDRKEWARSIAHHYVAWRRGKSVTGVVTPDILPESL